jgi:hypothetical protein
MLFRKNVIEKSFMNWRVFLLIKINIRIQIHPVQVGNRTSKF